MRSGEPISMQLTAYTLRKIDQEGQTKDGREYRNQMILIAEFTNDGGELKIKKVTEMFDSLYTTQFLSPT